VLGNEQVWPARNWQNSQHVQAYCSGPRYGHVVYLSKICFHSVLVDDVTLFL
jgi:hypothetical protein